MPMLVVAILTVKREALDVFREYESRAAAIMRDYGGRIDRTVIVDTDPTTSYPSGGSSNTSAYTGAVAGNRTAITKISVRITGLSRRPR